MKIAVTGANGFVGRHVVAQLLARGVSPVLVLRPGSPAAPAFAQLPQVPMDLARPPADAFDALGRPDMLMHLAWGGLPHFKSPRHVEEELPVQLAFLRGMLQAGLKGLLVTGTCLEYGMAGGALREDFEGTPVTAYGSAKDMLRRALERERAAHGFTFTWARLFYLYGEGQASGSLLPQLRAAVQRGDAVFRMSGGEQLRDYLEVGEMARLLVTLALQAPDAGVVNVCSGRPVSVRDMVRQWIGANGWAIAPEYGSWPYPDYEPMEFWGDRGKLDRIVASTLNAA